MRWILEGMHSVAMWQLGTDCREEDEAELVRRKSTAYTYSVRRS